MNLLLRPRAFHSTDWAFVVTVAAALGSNLLTAPFSWPQAGTVLALGALYTLVGRWGFEICAQRKRPGWGVLYFAIQISLAAVITYTGRAGGFLLLLVFPLVSQAQTLFSGRGVLAVAAFIILASAGTVRALGASWNVIGTMTLTLSAGMVFVYAFTQATLREQQARAEVERLAADLRAANDRLREYALQAEELATAKERNRLAREIHDSLGHYLTVVNVQLEAAQAVMETDPARAHAALSKAQSLTQEGLMDVRRSVAALRAAPTEHRPLPEAIRILVDECRAAGVVAQLTVSGGPRPLPAQAELTLYRAAQEALTNIRKHAHASRADLTLDYGANGNVRLTARDNGVGSAAPDGGFGLLGLRERVQLLGGVVNVSTAPGEGFRLEVEVPVGSEQ